MYSSILCTQYTHHMYTITLYIHFFLFLRSDRADALGKLGVSYGLGVVVGPYIGGYLSTHYSEQLASGVAGAGCIVAVAIIWIFVPESTKRSSSVPTKKEAKDGKSGMYTVCERLVNTIVRDMNTCDMIMCTACSNCSHSVYLWSLKALFVVLQ